MSMRSRDEFRYLAMRAKKMVGRLTDSELPSAAQLSKSFENKGVSITEREAEILAKEIRIHRGVLNEKSYFAEDNQPLNKEAVKDAVREVIAEKPHQKQEVASVTKSEASHG